MPRASTWTRALTAGLLVAWGLERAVSSPSQAAWACPAHLTVRVRANDIRHALQDSRLELELARCCPVAWALCRALGVPLGRVTVGPYNVDCEVWQDHGSIKGCLPPEVTRALDQFDRTRTR
jgi:hypothetical protein